MKNLKLKKIPRKVLGEKVKTLGSKALKIKNIDLIQFVPLLFVLTLVANTAVTYTQPKVETPKKAEQASINIEENTSTQQSMSNKTEREKDKEDKNTEKAVEVKGGSLGLDKIKDGSYQGSGTGYRGAITVSVKVASHRISSISVLKNSDDAAFFNKAKAGVIASILSKQSLNVDAVSGATYSSKGIISAVKNALTGQEDTTKEAPANAVEKQEMAAGTSTNASSKQATKKLKKVKETGSYKDGTYIGSANGFRGVIKVSVTIQNDKIKSIKILSKKDDESFFNKAKAGILSAILKKQSTNVDAVSGATYSSNGIISAVRNALDKAKTSKKSKATTKTEKTTQAKPTTEKVTTEATSESTTERENATAYSLECTVIADEWGDFEDYKMRFEVLMEDGKIVEIRNAKDLSSSYHTTNDKAYIAPAIKGFNKQISAGKQVEQIDVVSGATCTSKGVKQSILTFLENQKDKEEDAKQEQE